MDNDVDDRAVEGDRRLVIVLWNGVIGGAETNSLALAVQMRRAGLDVSLLFISEPQPLVDRVVAAGVPYYALGLARGRDVLRYPRRYAAAVGSWGPDGAVLMTCGYMGAALRLGGYRGSIVAVEHGEVLEVAQHPWWRRVLWWWSRLGGALADTAEVGVSNFTHQIMQRYPRAASCDQIYNGIDPALYSADRTDADQTRCVIAFAGRLITGKGADDLIEAAAQFLRDPSVTLEIAGEGPERTNMEILAQSLGIGHRVTFRGLVEDMPTFWSACDIAVVPSSGFIESCPLTAIEAMASSKPVVAARNGGLPELVVDGVTGQLFAPGDIQSLAMTVGRYIEDEDLRLSHGHAGRARVEDRFDIADTARSYLALLRPA